jgi:hypothetical protein
VQCLGSAQITILTSVEVIMSAPSTPPVSKDLAPASSPAAKRNPTAFGQQLQTNAQSDRKLAGHVCTSTCTHAGATIDT